MGCGLWHVGLRGGLLFHTFHSWLVCYMIGILLCVCYIGWDGVWVMACGTQGRTSLSHISFMACMLHDWNFIVCVLYRVGWGVGYGMWDSGEDFSFTHFIHGLYVT